MPRQAKLGKKNGHWFTKAGNPSGVYFGRVGEVTYQDAKRKFADYLKGLAPVRSAAPAAAVLTTAELVDLFLDWVQAHRSDRTYDERKRHLQRFIDFKRGERVVGVIPAVEMQATDLTAFLADLKQRLKLDPFTVDKHATSIKAAFHWGCKHPSPVPHLPPGFRPFASVEKYKRPPEPMLEDELPTPDEIELLLKWADADLALIRDATKVEGKRGRPLRSRRPDEFRPKGENPYEGFEDVLRVYWHTGARTGELAACTVSDFVRSAKQIVLGRHKRAHTMKEAVSRRITLNAEAFAILEKWCKGKRGDEPIFTDPKGRAWMRMRLDNRFEKVRTRAGVRKEITIYSFRHLWISEMLMAGVDVATVAKMAGTSIAMIEKVYGHFTNQHFLDAQGRLDAVRQARAGATGPTQGVTAAVPAEANRDHSAAA
jgi:integrase